MASPEVVKSSGILVPGEKNDTFYEEPFEIEGWKKKLMLKKGGTPKKKDVVYVAPDGEEIRNKRQLEKYLKNHPGGPSVADFDWSTGETPRRSARLSSKGRLSSDSTEEEPAFKRSKSDADEDEDPVIVVSPRKPTRRKSGPAVVTAGKDEVLEDTQKGQLVDSTGADGLTVDSDSKLADENEFPLVEEALQNNTDGKEGVTGTAEEANVGEFAEQVPSTEEVNVGGAAEQVPPAEETTSVGISVNQVNAEEQASKVAEPLILPDTVMEEVTVDEEVVTTVIEVSAVKEVDQPTDGDPSLKDDEDLKETVNEDSLGVPTTEHLDGTGDDPLKSKDYIESHGIHAPTEEPVLSGVTKSPEQQTDHPLPAAERVGVST